MTIQQICKQYEAATEFFLEVVRGLAPENLDRKADGEWSARQVVHHMADSEAQSYARLRRLLAEPEGSAIQGYDEGAWAKCTTLGYEELPIQNSIAVFAAVRSASLDVLSRIGEADLEKYGIHTESGKYTLQTWIDTYSKHPIDHGNQILRAIDK